MAQDSVAVKRGVLSDLASAFDRLLALAESLPNLEPSDEWGPFEVLSHIDGWHLSAAGRLRQIGAGGEVLSPGEADILNQRFMGERRGLSGAELLERLRLSFAEMRAAAESVPASEYSKGEGGMLDSLAYFIVNANGPEHYHEHMQDLRAGAP